MTILGENVVFPPWAKLIRPQGDSTPRESHDSPGEREIEEEEVYIRKRCFHLLSEQMDQTMKCVMQESLSSCVATLEELLDASNPTIDQESTPSRKRQKQVDFDATSTVSLEGLESELFDRQQESYCLHDPLLLPVVLLQGPSFGADRRAQMDCLAKKFEKSRPLSAVIQMELSSQRNYIGMQELVKKCHCLSAVLSTGGLYRRIVKRKKKKACSFSDLLLLWASLSEYSEIVIFLDADELLYSTELRDFLHTLAAKRAEQGIPVSVVMLEPPEGRRHIELRSSRQGYAGFVVRALALPSCEHVLHNFWRHLWIQENFPILFSLNALKDIKRSYLHHQKSCDRTLHKLSQLLASKLLQAGSFLAVALSAPVKSELWDRMAWFLSYTGGRVGESTINRGCSGILKVLKEIPSDYQSAALCLHLMESIKSKHNSSSLSLFKPTFSGLFRGTTRRELLQGLLNLRKQIDVRNDAGDRDETCMKKHLCNLPVGRAHEMVKSVARQQTAGRKRFVNEMVVIVSNCRDGDDLTEIEQLFDEVLQRWASCNTKIEGNSDAEPKLKTNDTAMHSSKCLGDSLASEPRKEIVAALLLSSEVWHWPPQQGRLQVDTRDSTCPLASVSGIMYRLIKDRVALTQEEWVEAFRHQMLDMGNESNSEHIFYTLFSLGLRYLKQCGLVAEKLRVGSTKDIIYERAKLVYCSPGG